MPGTRGANPLSLPPAAPHRPVAPAQGSAPAASAQATAARGPVPADPDLPARVPEPLYCPLPFEIPAGRDLVVRCLTQRKQRRSAATLYYRLEGTSEDYTTLPMRRSPKGWLMAVVPGHAIHGRSLSYYVRATLPGISEALYLGHPEAPNAFIIRESRLARSGEGSAGAAGRAESAPSSDLRGSRLCQPRPIGAFWAAIGMGTGAAYHGRETVDSNDKLPGSDLPVTVGAGYSFAGQFQIEPEIGYQWTRQLSTSLLVRYQYAPAESAGFVPSADEHAIRTSAFATFARAQWSLPNLASLQPYASGGVGVGTSFLATVSRRCTAASCTLGHSDTLHGGPFGLTAGLGAIYPVSRRLGIFLDIKEIATVPEPMALTEFSLGFAMSYPSSASPQRAADAGKSHRDGR